MLYKSNVPVTIEINTVQDLSKLGAFMKHNNLKVNKSEIARALNINLRTVTKYLNGFQKCTHRNKPSRLDDYFKKGHISNADSYPVIRFETKAGCQVQIDWKESLDFVLRDTGEVVTINVLVLVFSYSRFRMFNLSLSKSRKVLIHLLSECFDMIGGVAQEIVTDNTPTFIIQPFLSREPL